MGDEFGSRRKEDVMRISRLLVVILLGALALLPVGSTLAGGWASVEIENGPDEIVSGEPVTFEVVVKGHGISETDADELTITATNPETGETIEATATKGDQMGHYTVELTFPSDGEWSLQGTPAPYPPFDMSPITVGQAAMNAQDFVVMVADVGCDDLHPAGTTLDLTEANGALVGTFDGAGQSLWLSRAAGSYAACGTLPSSLPEGRSIVPFDPIADGDTAAIAVVDRSDNGVTVAVYPVPLTAPAHVATVEITGGMGGGQFGPGTLNVERGTLVTWVNDSSEGHTVVIDSKDDMKSGLIGPGESFSLEFDEPGEYRYSCGPHPNMKGTIVVS
jgi:plastocyanin